MTKKSFREVASSALYQRIWATVDAIPRGCVASYGEIASEAGLEGRARLVGRALRLLPDGSRLPWHRVVNARGEISHRGDPVAERAQRARLEREGVRFDARGRVIRKDPAVSRSRAPGALDGVSGTRSTRRRCASARASS